MVQLLFSWFKLEEFHHISCLGKFLTRFHRTFFMEELGWKLLIFHLKENKYKHLFKQPLYLELNIVNGVIKSLCFRFYLPLVVSVKVENRKITHH